jgi:O-methyltransferase involved in polyketide biosynthesis
MNELFKEKNLNLSNISKTAINTLIMRAVESEEKFSKFNDPMAVGLLERLILKASEEDKKWISGWKKRYASPFSRNRKAGIQRVNRLDEGADNFIGRNSPCIVINLGCGFDTRFWRIKNSECKYIELDLPDVIEIKRDLFGDKISYELIGCSVFDPDWIDHIILNGNKNILFIAEGLLYYLPKNEVVKLFQQISQKVKNSQIVFDTIPDMFTKGVWKWIGNRFMGTSWTFGIKNNTEVESFASGLKVISVDKFSGFSVLIVSINTE